MNTRSLAGDTVDCNVRGLKFRATYEGRYGARAHWVKPFSKNVSHRVVRARQIESKVERQEALA